MSCVYCEGGRNLISRSEHFSLKGDFYPGVDVCIDGNELYVNGCADTYEPNYIEESIKINFCPMCGRQL